MRILRPGDPLEGGSLAEEAPESQEAEGERMMEVEEVEEQVPNLGGEAVVTAT